MGPCPRCGIKGHCKVDIMSHLINETPREPYQMTLTIFFLLFRNRKSINLKKMSMISLVVQWLRICLPMRETWLWSLVREDSTCYWVTKPVSCNYRSPHTLECVHFNKRSHNRGEKPCTATRDSLRSSEDPAQSKVNKYFLKIRQMSTESISSSR